MKTQIITVIMTMVTIFCLVFTACGSKPAPVSSGDELDTVIRETSDYLNNQLPQGNKLVILNIQSVFPALSEYIIDELIANMVSDQIFSVVDRQQLNSVRAELDFQMSGEVSDDSAQRIGQMLGAQIIISGAVSKIGDLYRLRIRALNVQSAEIVGQFNKNIPNNPTVAALVSSRATGYGNTTPTANANNRAVASAPVFDKPHAIVLDMRNYGSQKYADYVKIYNATLHEQISFNVFGYDTKNGWILIGPAVLKNHSDSHTIRSPLSGELNRFRWFAIQSLDDLDLNVQVVIKSNDILITVMEKT